MEHFEWRMMRKREVCELLGGISPRTLDRMVAEGVIPRPYKVSTRNGSFRSDEIKEYLENLKHHTAGYCNTKQDKEEDQLMKDSFSFGDDEETF